MILLICLEISLCQLFNITNWLCTDSLSASVPAGVCHYDVNIQKVNAYVPVMPGYIHSA